MRWPAQCGAIAWIAKVAIATATQRGADTPSFRGAWNQLRDLGEIVQVDGGWELADRTAAEGDGPPATWNEFQAQPETPEIAPSPALARCRERHPEQVHNHRNTGSPVCHLCSPPAYLRAEGSAA